MNIDRNYEKQSKSSSNKQFKSQNQNDRMNRKRSYKERDEDYYDDEKIEERVKSSLNQFFYYDQEKQKYFRKKDEHKNPIWEGSEIGKIDQIEEVEIDPEEQPFSIYDMEDVEKNQIQLNPRDIIYKYKSKFSMPNEFLYFFMLKDLINSFKAEYVEKYFSNQMNSKQQAKIKLNSQFLCINEYKAKVVYSDFVSHNCYNLIVLAIKSEQQNTVSFIIISINKYFQSQIIKLVPNIQYQQFIKLLIIKQNPNQNILQQNNEIESEEPDYCLYVTKKSIAIFKYEMINIQNIQQSFVEQISINFEILGVEQFQNGQIITLTRKELTCYCIRQKRNIFKIHFQNYNALFMRVCAQNTIAVVYTESQKLLVICLSSRRILFAKIVTNLTDIALMNEKSNKILFVYQRLKQSLFFIVLEKQGNKWEWKKLGQNPLQFGESLSVFNFQLSNQSIQIIKNSLYIQNKIICLHSFDREQYNTNQSDEQEEQSNKTQVFLQTFFQIRKTLYLIYYNDYQIQIQYSHVDSLN
ncbi:hypothetical protein ABPG74_004661 [Tetrahymena malaccensis]